MKRIIGYLTMAMALTACGSDDEILNEVQHGDIHPLLFTATVEGIQTRVTNDTWDDSDEIGVKISTNLNAIGKYALNADGTVKEVIKGVNWQGTEPATVTAWYPLEDQNLNIADQSEGLKGMNLLKAELENQTYEEGKTLQLVFRHQMARVRCRLVAADGSTGTDFSGATVKFLGKTTVTVHDGTMTSNSQTDIEPNITTENGYKTYTALLPPQTITANAGFIKVTMGGKTLYYRPAKEIMLEAGKTYNYQIKVGVSGYKIDANGVYHVSEAEGLTAWAEAVKNNPKTNCILEENITMSGNWTPISSFKGTFDGNEHTISGLTVNETANPAGFISRLDGGTVKNLTLENVNITGKNNPAGGVAGYCNGGTIENCHVTGTGKIRVTEESLSSDIGGIVGSNRNGTILACHVSKECSVGTTVTSGGTNIFVGGIVGTNTGGTVKGCYALCLLYGIQVGGICGWSQTSDGTACYIACYSNFSYNESNSIGGILGMSSGNPTFKECYWAANILNGVGNADSDLDGITKATDWSAAATAMNTALGSNFGYQYEVNSDSQITEPLVLKKNQQQRTAATR